MKVDAPQTEAATLLVDIEELARLLAVSVSTAFRMKAAGKLPGPLSLSRGCVRWRRDTIERWLSESEAQGRLLDRKTWDALQTTNGRTA